MARGPDFLVIGAARCGTTFLHAHLRTHPQIWLSPKKEIYYFSYQAGRGYLNRRQREHVPAFLSSLPGALGRQGGARRDLAWGARYLAGRPSDAWYLSLQPDRDDAVAGQIEPSYANLPEATIRRIAALMPDLKLVLMMRDPIDRAWSQVLKRLARSHGRPISDVAEADIIDEFQRHAMAMSCYAEILDRWERAFPGREVFCTFYEDLLRAPRRVIDDIARFVGAGAHPTVSDAALARPVNDTEAYRQEIPTRYEHWLARRLIAATEQLAARFPRPAETWACRMRAALTKS